MDEDYGDPFSEYGDFDSIACATGDYNAYEENQVFLDHEDDEDFRCDIYDEVDYPEEDEGLDSEYWYF